MDQIRRLDSAVEHHRAGRLEQALALYQEILGAEPANGAALAGLCQVLETLSRSEEALPFLDRALTPVVEPEWKIQVDMAWRRFQLGLVDEALALFRRAATGEFPEPAHAGIAAIIPGSRQCDHQAVGSARRLWAQLCVPAPGATEFRKPPATPDRPLRVGYVSSFFQCHNWMKPVWGLIHQHDRQAFEIHLFSDAPASEIRHGYRPHPQDRFHDISELSNQEAAEQVESAGIDLLVDLNGYSQLPRLPLLGLRPAPVIVEWFNMYAPSGLSAVDYLVGDDVVIPPEEEGHYSETIVRVPGSYLTFEVGYPVPDVVVPPCSTRAAFTFGCLAPLYKITPEVVASWSLILQRAPGSRLILRNSALHSPDAMDHVHALFHERGIPPDLYDLEGPAEHFQFLETYGRIDLALDTFPYSGGTTTTEAIWQGVPVVTFPGDRWVARTSASILQAGGLGRFVARNLEEYVALASGIANSPDRGEFLAEIRQGIRARLSRSPVCDTAGFARYMERLYRQMLRLPPKTGTHPPQRFR